MLPFPLRYTVPSRLHGDATARLVKYKIDTMEPEVHPTGYFQGKQKAIIRSQAKQIRIHDLAEAFYSILESRLSDRPFLQGTNPTSLDCYAFGILSLHYFPALPNAFLRKQLKNGFPRTAKYITDLMTIFFQDSRPLVRRVTVRSDTRSILQSLWVNLRNATGIPRQSSHSEVIPEDRRINAAVERRSKVAFAASSLFGLLVFVLVNGIVSFEVGQGGTAEQVGAMVEEIDDLQ